MRSPIGPSLVAILVLAAAAPRTAAAQEAAPAFGVGLIVGSPTGLSLKYYLGDSGRAIDAAIGGAVASDQGFDLHADYLFHPALLSTEDAFDLVLYLGVGGRFLVHDRGSNGDDDFHIGLRGPIGVLFDFNNVPLDAFLEVAPILDLAFDDDDDTRPGDEGHAGIGIDINAGLGVRYYF